MEELVEILQKIKPGVDFQSINGIVTNGYLDSLSIIRLASEINTEYDIEIPVIELVPQNFDSLDAMWSMIQRLQEDQ